MLPLRATLLAGPLIPALILADCGGTAPPDPTFPSTSSVVAHLPTLALHLEPAVIDAKVGGAIAMRVYLEAGNEPTLVPKTIDGLLSLEALDPDGHPLMYRGPFIDLVPFMHSEDFVSLPAGGIWGMRLDLTNSFQFREPGDYAVVASWHNESDGQDLAIKAWTGKLQSNRVLVRVKN